MPILPPVNLASATATEDVKRMRRKQAKEDLALKEAEQRAKENQPLTSIVLPNVPEDVANTSDLLTKATGVISRELKRLDAKSFERRLDPRAGTSVTTLIKAISAINAEERLLAQRSALDGMSDEELEILAQQAINRRKSALAPASAPAEEESTDEQ